MQIIVVLSVAFSAIDNALDSSNESTSDVADQ